jgi:hypothetical protein
MAPACPGITADAGLEYMAAGFRNFAKGNFEIFLNLNSDQNHPAPQI